VHRGAGPSPAWSSPPCWPAGRWLHSPQSRSSERAIAARRIAAWSTGPPAP